MKSNQTIGYRLRLDALFRFKPNKSLIVVAISYLAVIGFLSMATYVATPAHGMYYFLLYAVACAGIAGIATPFLWTLFVERKSLATLGITRKRIWWSLLLQVIFVLFIQGELVRTLQGKPWERIVPLVALSLAIGFFEAVFWRGWLFQKLESAFGIVPGMLFGSALYAMFHIGYGMTGSEMVFLFFIGLMFCAAFMLTRNIFILWPVFQPMGQLITVAKEGLELPLIATLGFVEILILFLVFALILTRKHRKMVKTTA